MENIRDLRTRHENRRRLALACAKALEGPEGLPGTPSAYKVYLQVPVCFLGQDTDGSEKGNLDLLICRARDGMAALAVVFDIGGDRVTIPERLVGLDVRRFELSGDLDGAQLAHAADAVCKAAAQLPADAGKVCGPAALDTRPLRLVLTRLRIPMPQDDALVKGQILYPDGAVTPYGARCRLVLRRVRGKDGWTDELAVPVGQYIPVKKALKFSRELRRPSRIPLRDRLDAAVGGMPSDSAYPAHMAALLQELLAAPIGDILADVKVPERVRQAFPGGLDCGGTYGGALQTARDLVRSYLEDRQNWEMCELAGDILAALLTGFWLEPRTCPDVQPGQQSLRRRLAGCRGVPGAAQVIQTPLPGYLQGAAARLGTGYPCCLCRTRFGPAQDTIKTVGKHLTREWAHRDFFDDEYEYTYVPGSLIEMYGLLVEPFYPDVDAWLLLGGWLSAMPC